MNGAWSEFEQFCRVERVQATDLLQLYMDNLKAGTYYRIELKAHNAMGYSQPRALVMKTARGELGSENYESVAYEASFASSASVERPAAVLVGMASVLMKIVLSVVRS